MNNLLSFLGILNIHKPNHPLRPIGDYHDVPTAKLSNFVVDILNKAYYLSNPYDIRNTLEFVDAVKNIHIPDDNILISLDVVFLFNSIPFAIVQRIIYEN